MRNVYGPLRRLERTQWASDDELQEVQLRRLKAIVRHAWENTGYFREVFRTLKIHPDDIRSFTDFKQLPILTKAIIKDRFDDLKAANLKESEVHFSDTGGTTGIKIRFCRDNACLSPKAAATLRQERWTGWDIGQPRALAWPAEQDYVGYNSLKSKVRNAFCKREIALPAAVLNGEKIERFLNEIKRKRPVLLLGFPTPLYLIAKWVLENGESDCTVASVISTGEPLFGHQREAIIKAFQCDVFDSYRTREVGLIAQECPEHSGMHYNAEHLYLESVLDEKTGLWKLLVTDFLNHGMPFIRYEIGDTGSLSQKKCPCGRSLPLLEMGVGRSADVMYSPEGNLISAVTLVLYLVDNGPPVGQAQVIQDSLTHLQVRITKEPAPTQSLYEHYRKEIRRLFGDAMKVSFELVDSIAKEPSGKYRFAICKVPGKVPVADEKAEYPDKEQVCVQNQQER